MKNIIVFKNGRMHIKELNEVGQIWCEYEN